MAITNVVQKIMSFIQNKISHPFATIPAIMIICSTIKRPGLSPMQITSRVINRFGENGLLIGTNIDGSQNLTNQAVFMIVDEIVKAIKLDSKVMIGVPPGAIVSQGTATGGVVTTTNTAASTLQGITV